MPLMPVPVSNRMMVRFLALSVVSLLFVILSIELFRAMGASNAVTIALAMGWMVLSLIGAAYTLRLRWEEERRLRSRLSEWRTDSRRLALDRLGIDLSARRVPQNLMGKDIEMLEKAAGDWREGREALEALAYLEGEMASTRDVLNSKMDDAMLNLLAEAGGGCVLGLSPFAVERACLMFQEIAGEARQIAASRDSAALFPVDDSIEAMRPALEKLRAARCGKEEAIPLETRIIPNPSS